MSDNPLLFDGFPIPFDQVRAEHVKPAVDRLLEQARRRLTALEEATEPPTFDNTLVALEASTEPLERAMHIVGHLEGVSTSDALREAYNEAQPRVSELLTQIPLSAELWRRLQAFADTPKARALTGPRRRFFEKTLRYFKRHGAELDEAGKQRLAAIDVELTKLTLKFGQNGLDATNAFELIVEDEARLSGLPDSAKQAARASAEAKGKPGWRFTLQAPSYVPLLTYLDDRAIREHVYRAATTRATSDPYDNRPILARVLCLRAEKARLLGYANFADLVLEERMAKSAERAREFVADLAKRTREHFDREAAELAAYRCELEGPDAPALEPWDLAYYAEKLRRARYDFDEEALRPYFTVSNVIEGLFTIASRLYGVRFEPWQDAPKWDDSVRAFKVLDHGEWLAGIYIDIFPRESKHGGAWMDGILSRTRIDADRRQIGALMGNMTPPVGDAEAQLTHHEVETMFHELGHLMHHCLSRTELKSQAGTSVAWDFVELPSQMFENWAWEREALDLFARHADTGATIPERLLEAMNAARTFRAATAQMRQLGFASLDLALHVDYDPERDGDVLAYAREVMQPFSPVPLPADYAMVASFDHLFSSPVGYAAGYYSYKWAEVLDADAFTRFKREGLLSSEVGQAFRTKILERGDEEEAEVLFRDFMGREPRLDALLERLGMAS